MYDLKEIKAIPIGEVASKYGIQLKEKGNRLWGKLRENEKTASFSINLKKNLWYDFGSGKGGSVIDLVAEIEGISPTEAINKIAEDYGFTNEKTTGWRPLTDRQYRELGIQPERATMNFGFDLDKHTVEQLSRWSSKYGMPVRELAETYPNVYNKMVHKIAMEQISVLRDTYQARINMYHEATNKDTKSFFKSFAKSDADEINRKVELLGHAIKPAYVGQVISMTYLMVNLEKDLKAQSLTNSLSLNEDQKIRDHIVKVYKKLFDFKLVEHFTVEQAKALQEINKAIVNGENKYIPIDGIKKTYEKLGQSLERLETEYTGLMIEGGGITDHSSIQYKDWESKTNLVEKELSKVKELFSKCNTVIDGIREANLLQKSALAKENTLSSPSKDDVEISL